MGTLFILAILITTVGFIITSMIKKHKKAKKSGTSSCCCGCTGCSKHCL